MPDFLEFIMDVGLWRPSTCGGPGLPPRLPRRASGPDYGASALNKGNFLLEEANALAPDTHLPHFTLWKVH
ncbi:hypothetical protein NQ318_021232 [Aromia moschata]|uniref:Uncharacterized protein n=1 Tax=Aromia moschata TaxID=1265417 RepID=A0AAV8Y2A0_9CUCU|nr:hypothetical protein NQ318_021232 [Aromia moschata]